MNSRARRRALAFAPAAALCWLVSRGSPEILTQKAATIDTFRVVKAYPHDATTYTQGLIYREGFLFESTGLNGRSTLRQVKLETGEVVRQHRLDQAYLPARQRGHGGHAITLDHPHVHLSG